MTYPPQKRAWTVQSGSVANNNTLVGTGYTVATDNRAALYALKEALIAAVVPWTVVSSCNASTTSASDLWTSASALNWSTSTGSARSWIVLYSSALSTYLVIDLVDVASSSGARIQTVLSVVGFTGGSTTARPTAIDEVKWFGDHATSSINQWGVGSGLQTHDIGWFLLQSTNGLSNIIILTNNSTSGTGLWVIERPDDVPVGFVDGCIAYKFATNSPSVWSTGAMFDTIEYSSVRVVSSMFNTNLQTVGTSRSSVCTLVHERDGSDALLPRVVSPVGPGLHRVYPMYVAVTQTINGFATQSILLGSFTDLYCTSYGGTSIFDMVPVTAGPISKLYCFASTVMFPWTGAAAPSFCPPGGERDVIINQFTKVYTLQSSGGSLVLPDPVISFITVSPILPTDSFIIEVTADLGTTLSDISIVANYTSGVEHAIYTPAGFLDTYDGTSSTAPITGGTQFTVYNDDNWYENFTVTVYATDETGNAVSSTTGTITVTAGLGFPAVDSTPPVISFVTAAGTIDASDPIEVDVTDDILLKDVVIEAVYASGTETVYSSFGFNYPYSTSSTSSISGGTKYTLRNDTGWYEDLTVNVHAIDAAGFIADDNRAWLVTGGSGYPIRVLPGAAPTINWITAAGAHLAADPVVVEVTDDLNYTDAIIWATYGATKQLIHGGGEFSGKYSGSSATPIAGGYSFSLLCDDNWYEDFTIHILASDQYGNTTLDTRAFTVADGLGLPLEIFDGDAPAINWVTAAGTLPAADPVVVEVTDDLSYEDTTIWAIFGVNKFIIYSNGEFASSFSGSSITPITGGVSFNLVCSPGWFSAFTLYVLGRDTADQTTLDSRTWLVYDGPGVPVVPSVDDTESPVLSDIEPASLTGLRKLDPISFTVSDNSGFVLTTTISVEYANGDHEVVYNGGFSRKFAPSSRRVATVNGYRYTLRRAGGWASEPTIWVIVYDRTGNSLRLQVS